MLRRSTLNYSCIPRRNSCGTVKACLLIRSNGLDATQGLTAERDRRDGGDYTEGSFPLANSLPVNRNRAILLLIVVLPIACLFGPALVRDCSFAMRDAAHFYYPLFEWTTREWAGGRVPLWNPYENGGLPVVADASSSIFYPGKLLFVLPLGFALNYKLYITLHVLLAAAGVYGLARHWQASAIASAVAAISYALGGNVVFQYCNVVFLVGAAWLRRDLSRLFLVAVVLVAGSGVLDAWPLPVPGSVADALAVGGLGLALALTLRGSVATGTSIEAWAGESS